MRNQHIICNLYKEISSPCIIIDFQEPRNTVGNQMLNQKWIFVLVHKNPT